MLQVDAPQQRSFTAGRLDWISMELTWVLTFIDDAGRPWMEVSQLPESTHPLTLLVSMKDVIDGRRGVVDVFNDAQPIMKVYLRPPGQHHSFAALGSLEAQR